MQFNGMKSGFRNATCGVSQGCILGSKLFLLYIIDICYASNMLDIILYTDDIKIFTNMKILI